MDSLILLPQPRRLNMDAGRYRVEPGKQIALVGAPAQDLLFSGTRLAQALTCTAKVDWTITAAIANRKQVGAVLRVDPALPGAEAYELSVGTNGIEIVAGTPHGIFNAVSTLIQMLEQTPGLLPCLHISDAPDYAARGVLLDVSRDKVPTMETLFALIDMLASWKINQLQLYIEHTFAYQNHPAVWQDASPLTGHEILELDRYCRERFISLVPNQNSFGHLHRWLCHPEYNHLAECPDARGNHWWGSGPYGLNPLDPRALEWICSLYDELLPHFTDSRFNVGCDETFDLGQGHSQQQCNALGIGRVYLDFLLKIYSQVRARGRTMMFWGDIMKQYPDLLAELPRDVIALDWGYEAEYRFDDSGARFSAAGIPFYVCPGTSSWNSISGRSENAIANIARAAKAGLEHGAIGLLTTDWGDGGHWQPLPVSYLGFAFGAAMSWCVESNRALDLPGALDLFAFRDRAGVMGSVAYNLGNVYRETGIELENGTVLFHLLTTPLSRIRARLGALAPEYLACTLEAIESAVSPLSRADMHCADGDLISQEFELVARMLRHAAQRGTLASEENAARADKAKIDLVCDLDTIVDGYTQIWHARNRPGGFRDSIARLEQLRQDYR